MIYEYKLHLTVLNPKKSFNAVSAIEKFKDYKLGVIKLQDIQISNRKFIESYDKERFKRS